MNQPFHFDIDVVSDVVCPWCYLGKRRLEAAIAARPDAAVNLRWRPFQLDPAVPPAGADRDEYMRRKHGDGYDPEPVRSRLTAFGRDFGIDYRFDRISRTPNTLDAHRVIRWAAAAGLQDTMVERLFKLYFSDGQDIGDPAVLAAAAGDLGMDADRIATDLASDHDREAVQSEIAAAGEAGIGGVPFFVFAGKYGISGAHEAETLADIMRQVTEMESPTA